MPPLSPSLLHRRTAVVGDCCCGEATGPIDPVLGGNTWKKWWVIVVGDSLPGHLSADPTSCLDRIVACQGLKYDTPWYKCQGFSMRWTVTLCGYSMRALVILRANWKLSNRILELWGWWSRIWELRHFLLNPSREEGGWEEEETNFPGCAAGVGNRLLVSVTMGPCLKIDN